MLDTSDFYPEILDEEQLKQILDCLNTLSMFGIEDEDLFAEVQQAHRKKWDKRHKCSG